MQLMRLSSAVLALGFILQTTTTTTIATELDDEREAWLEEKGSSYNLATEQKEIILFLEDKEPQDNLSGFRIEKAISYSKHNSRAKILNTAKELQRSHKEFSAKKTLWASRAIVSSTTRSLLKSLKKDARIEAIIANKVVELGIPMRGIRPLSASEVDSTYGLKLINASHVNDRGHHGRGVRVGIIDSGIDMEHPDLQGKVVLAKDFTKDGHTNDRNGHGTHVAGTIAGGNASGTQIGVAPEAELIIAKVFDDRGSTDFATLLEAMEWMLNPDGDDSTADAPRVVNNSWGANSQFIIGFRNIVQTWRRFEVFPNFAAGNAGPRWMSTGAPARYPFSFAVAAIDEKTEVTSFSSRGPSLWVRAWGMGEGLPWYKKWMPLLYTKPDVSAPGYEVLSSLPGGKYGRYSGTSMATPHVTGVIALMLEVNPQLSVDQIEDILMSTSIDLRADGKDNASGFGLIQADLAVQSALRTEGELSEEFVDSDLSEWSWQTP